MLAAYPKCRVIAVDQDPVAFARAQALAMDPAISGRIIPLRGRFGDLLELIKRQNELSNHLIDGIVFDIGVSSDQIDFGERGFSYLHDGPLDMRMCAASTQDPSLDKLANRMLTAEHVVNHFSAEELSEIIRKYGEERYAKSIAASIVYNRNKEPILSTKRLADIVSRTIRRRQSDSFGKDQLHPAARTLRIFINDELNELKHGLEASEKLLQPGGRLVVVTFHSLEDRIVKNFLQTTSRPDVHQSTVDDALSLKSRRRNARKVTRVDELRNPEMMELALQEDLKKLRSPSSQPVVAKQNEGSFRVLTRRPTIKDDQGNTLKGAHVLGFFRRICKLLFHGIKPVFVFDGAAPTLKRKTIIARRKRKTGAEDSIQKTAEKLLEARLKLAALQNHLVPSTTKTHSADSEDLANAGYFEDTALDHHGGSSSRKRPSESGSGNASARDAKRLKDDEFDLPILTPKETLDHSNDPRLADESELRDFIQQHQAEIAFGAADFDSATFAQLPIILDLKTHSREASSSRVAELLSAPSAIEFSMLQIRNLVHRNTLTEKLFHIAKTGGVVSNPNLAKRSEQFEKRIRQQVPQRIASVKGRDYLLIKNDDAAGAGHTLKFNMAETGKIVDKGKIVRPNASSSSINVSVDHTEKIDVVVTDDDEEEEDEIFEEVVHSTTVVPPLTNSAGKARAALNEENIEDEDDTPLFSDSEDESFEKLSSRAVHSKNTTNIGGQSTLAISHYQKVQLKDQSSVDVVTSSLISRTLTHDSSSAAIPYIGEEGFSESDALSRNAFESSNEGEIGKEILSPQHSEANSDFVSGLLEKPLVEEASSGNVFSTIRANSPGARISAEMKGKATVVAKEFEDPGETGSNSQSMKSLVVDRSLSSSEILSNDGLDDGSQEDDIDLATAIAMSLEKDIHTSDFRMVDNHESPVEETQSMQATLDDTKVLTERVGIEDITEHEEEEFSRLVNQMQDPDALVNLEAEILSLRAKRNKDIRQNASVSEDIVRDSQELLTLFGLPYITAPMEAEAQCAFLQSAGLVDGIITDDSDVFLFGGSLIYKNVFNANKYVECYSTERLKDMTGLTRKDLILLAYLLGSDYTEGIPGIGIVTAVEILKEWMNQVADVDDDLECLKRFRIWVETVQKDDTAANTAFQKQFRKKAKALEIPDHFPNDKVMEAYLTPTVDTNEQRFEWGSPDLTGIRDFMWEKVGLSSSKTDEIVVPVLREMDKRRTEGAQTQMTTFFGAQGGQAELKHRSKRVERALKSLKGDKEGGHAEQTVPTNRQHTSIGRGSLKGRGRRGSRR
ncbi:DNA repair protein rad2 [Blyttiomyces sp. JEL0837]|nr:DNA repair protein rad2 [Blyttiomyces sp. JEL0837]